MEKIKIYAEQVGIEPVKHKVDYFKRHTARGIVRVGKRIALVYAGNLGVHKLPGGGIEKGESAIAAFKREVLEETGYKVSHIDNLGIIIVEYRAGEGREQYSSVFVGVGEKKSKPNWTEEEIADGFRLKLTRVTTAIDLLEQDNPQKENAKYIRKRELEILKKYREIYER